MLQAMVKEREEMSDERRYDSRLEVKWVGEIETEDGEVFECKIGDVSTGGTLIESEAQLEIGVDVILRVKNHGESGATVQWVGGNRAGLVLQISPSLLLKDYAEASGAHPSEEPVRPDGDPLAVKHG